MYIFSMTDAFAELNVSFLLRMMFAYCLTETDVELLTSLSDFAIYSYANEIALYVKSLIFSFVTCFAICFFCRVKRL